MSAVSGEGWSVRGAVLIRAAGLSGRGGGEEDEPVRPALATCRLRQY